MTNQREEILKRVRSAISGIEHRTAYPEYDDHLSVPTSRPLDGDLWEAFCERLRAVHGLPLETIEELAEYLGRFDYTFGYCDPELKPLLAPVFGEKFTLEENYQREKNDDYQFGITRAAGAIAESGSLVITDRGTSNRLGALAPWVHVACLKREEIFRDMPAALAAMDDDPNVIWITGPSKTADIEGILIEGVHGPGVQICLLLP